MLQKLNIHRSNNGTTFNQNNTCCYGFYGQGRVSHKECTGFYRGKVLFAKLQQEELYFLNNNGSFVKFDQPVDRSNIHCNLATAYNIAV